MENNFLLIFSEPKSWTSQKLQLFRLIMKTLLTEICFFGENYKIDKIETPLSVSGSSELLLWRCQLSSRKKESPSLIKKMIHREFKETKLGLVRIAGPHVENRLIWQWRSSAEIDIRAAVGRRVRAGRYEICERANDIVALSTEITFLHAYKSISLSREIHIFSQLQRLHLMHSIAWEFAIKKYC